MERQIKLVDFLNKMNNESKIKEKIESGFTLNREDKKITLIGVTPKGDHIEWIFNSPNRELYAQDAQYLLETYGSQYTLLPETHVFYLPPVAFWFMYKKKNKDLMRNVGSKLYINNEQYIFPDTNFYFDQASLELTGEKCVYGIKYKDEIIYINSTSQGVSNSWQEHAKAFQRKEINNPMYQLPIEDISFVILLTSEEIQEAIGESYYCIWTLKFAEWCFLQAYKPRYNSVFRNPFSFNVKPSENLPASYWRMMKDWLDNRFINIALQELNDEVIAENE